MTLPTRANGGINWDKLWPPETVRPEALRLSFIQVGKEAAAHARERCAKWHDEQAARWGAQAKLYPPGSVSNEYALDQAIVHADAAAAFREMED